MIGQTIRFRPSFSWASGFFLTIALVVIGLGWRADSIDLLLVAVLPFSVGMTLWLSRLRPQTIQFTEAGLVVERGPTIGYDGIESIRTSRGPADLGKLDRRFTPLQIVHRNGISILPPSREVSSAEICRFLFEQLPTSSSRDLGFPLADFRLAQENRFGKGQVRYYCARTHLGRGLDGRRIASIGLAGIATGVVWIAVSVIQPGLELWSGLGFSVAFIGILAVGVGMLDREQSSSKVKNWRASRLVIGPAGLAMIQGETQGELAWHQVRNIRFCPKPGWFTVTANQIGKGIHLEVEGAQIVIADVYDRPLHVIYQAVHSFWMRYQ